MTCLMGDEGRRTLSIGGAGERHALFGGEYDDTLVAVTWK